VARSAGQLLSALYDPRQADATPGTTDAGLGAYRTDHDCIEKLPDYELALDVDAGTPEIVRKEAMQIGRVMRRPAVASSREPGEGSQDCR